MVGTIHPGTVAEAFELTDTAKTDADICSHGVFFTDPVVARPWLDRHPGGRVIPVATFDSWWRHLLSRTGSDTPPTRE